MIKEFVFFTHKANMFLHTSIRRRKYKKDINTQQKEGRTYTFTRYIKLLPL